MKYILLGLIKLYKLTLSKCELIDEVVPLLNNLYKGLVHILPTFECVKIFLIVYKRTFNELIYASITNLSV